MDYEISFILVAFFVSKTIPETASELGLISQLSFAHSPPFLF